MNETVRLALQALLSQWRESTKGPHWDDIQYYRDQGKDSAADDLEALLTIDFPEENKNLDPLPWVHHYDQTDRSTSDDLPGSLRDFRPRPGYSQDRKDYRG